MASHFGVTRISKRSLIGSSSGSIFVDPIEVFAFQIVAIVVAGISCPCGA
jgi:hypothetical protein